MNEAKDPTGRINQAELARRLKVSRASVSKAVKAGRITPDDEGLFDPVEAELQWLSNTRPTAKARRKAGSGSYAEARARKESALARMAELRLAQAEGDLIEREAVDYALTDFATTVCGLVENLADKLAPLVFQRPTLGEIHAIITEAGDDLLHEVAATMERSAREIETGANPAA